MLVAQTSNVICCHTNTARLKIRNAIKKGSIRIIERGWLIEIVSKLKLGHT